MDPHACEAHALCVEIAPEIFELSDADDVATCDDNPPESKITQVRAAIGGAHVRPSAGLKNVESQHTSIPNLMFNIFAPQPDPGPEQCRPRFPKLEGTQIS